MVASANSSAPLAVVIGVTGQQGGSVANALIDSAKPYRIVGLTRDVSKPKAKAWIEKGVNMREVNISIDNEAAVIKAFEGADIVFVSDHGRDFQSLELKRLYTCVQAVTSAADLRSKENEVAQGKLS